MGWTAGSAPARANVLYSGHAYACFTSGSIVVKSGGGPRGDCGAHIREVKIT
jgi:hypothetical protein